jgi:protein-arginine kinase activator protein McsA
MAYQSSEAPSTLDAFIVSAKIFEVLDGSQKIDCNSINHTFGIPELAETLQLNEKLDEIENTLPTHLKQNNLKQANTARDRVFKLQAEAVMMRCA